MTEVELLQTLLAAEHAADYGYGVLGARLDDVRRRQALEAVAAHRTHRDQLTTLLRARGAATPGPEASYDVTVVGAPDALALAARLEDGLAVRWRDLVGGTDDAALRRIGIEGLTGCAVRATRWRVTSGVAVATTALPG
ncbi:MAG TPA: ferritin-like domain-containing protein [Mycobacteriales bacterium]|nr:ferritin-like domain-containing protein [Mycobacteriales bacterium]